MAKKTDFDFKTTNDIDVSSAGIAIAMKTLEWLKATMQQQGHPGASLTSVPVPPTATPATEDMDTPDGSVLSQTPNLSSQNSRNRLQSLQKATNKSKHRFHQR